MDEDDPALGGARRPSGVPTLFHYTRIESMIAILSAGTIRLSSAATMNDSSEGAWLFGRLNDLDAEHRQAGRHRSREEQRTRDTLLWLASRGGDEQAYLASFSEKGDLLSQWRAYAQDGEGVAIGFDANDGHLPVIDAPPHSNAVRAMARTLNRVIYGPASLVEELDERIQTIMPDGVESNGFFPLQTELSRLRWLVKNPAFEEEHEWRIVNLPILQSAGDIGDGETSVGVLGPRGYRQAGNQLVSHYEMPFDPPAVTDIVLGPRCGIDERELKLLLGDHDLTHVRVRRSAATYRR